MYEKFGWNKDNMFFLTRDNPVEITSVEDLSRYANQCLFDVKEEPDEFGRNYIDKMFIGLCMELDAFVTCTHEPDVVFKSLSCEKIGDEYMACVKYDDVILEMELVKMVDYFYQKRQNRIRQRSCVGRE